MIPMFAILGWKGWRVWLPLFLVWILLLPICILIFPFFAIVCLIGGINPFRLTGVFLEMLAALRGTVIDVEQPPHFISIRII